MCDIESGCSMLKKSSISNDLVKIKSYTTKQLGCNGVQVIQSFSNRDNSPCRYVEFKRCRPSSVSA